MKKIKMKKIGVKPWCCIGGIALGCMMILGGYMFYDQVQKYDELEASNNQLQSDYDTLASESDAQKIENETLIETNTNLQNDYDELETENETLKEQNDDYELEIEELNIEIEDLENQVAAKKARQAQAAQQAQAQQSASYTQSSEPGVLTASKGVNYNANGNKETYYNMNMDNIVDRAKSMGIEGDYWIRDDGVKMYGDKVIVAANLNNYPRGSEVETSLGTGIVLDTGGFAANNPEQLDIAVDW